jgi:YVTN family beta-propeller protein
MRKLKSLLFATILIVLCLCPVASIAKPTAYVAQGWGTGNGRVVVIDGETHSIVESIKVGNEPRLDLSPNGDFVYVINYKDSTMYGMSTVDYSYWYKGFDGYDRPMSIKVSPKGDVAYVLTRNSQSRSTILHVIDLNTRQTIKKLGLASWGRDAIAFSPEGDLAYVASGSYIYVFDTTIHEEIAAIYYSISENDYECFKYYGITGIVFNESGDLAYATVPILKEYRKSWDSSGNFKCIYVGYGNSQLVAIDTSTHTVIDHVSLGPSGYLFTEPYGVDISPDGDILYVPGRWSDKVYVVDTASFSVIDEIDVKLGGYKIAFSPDGEFAYLANRGYHILEVIDTASRTVVDSISVGEPVSIEFLPDNAPPTANAGPDQVVECASADGAQVVLDGSASSDPDGDELTYTWEGPFGVAEGVSPTVAIPLGTHTIILTVDDGNGETATDEVVVTVQDTTPPATSAIISGTIGNDDWYMTDVTLSLIATDSCSGVKEVYYTVDGAQSTVSGDTATIIVSDDGSHTVGYWASDNSGNTASQRSESFKLDQTPPEITISGVADGATYALGLVPLAGYTATDATSGLASSSASLTGGDGLGLGTFVYTVTAEDNAGNTAEESVTYEVIATEEGTVEVIEDMRAISRARWRTAFCHSFRTRTSRRL